MFVWIGVIGSVTFGGLAVVVWEVMFKELTVTLVNFCIFDCDVDLIVVASVGAGVTVVTSVVSIALLAVVSASVFLERGNPSIFGCSLRRVISILTPPSITLMMQLKIKRFQNIFNILFPYFSSTPKVEKFLAITISSMVTFPADMVESLYLMDQA